MTFDNAEAPFKTLVFSRHQEIPVNFYCDREGVDTPFPVFHKVKDYGFCGFDIMTKKCEEVHQKTVCKRYFNLMSKRLETKLVFAFSASRVCASKAPQGHPGILGVLDGRRAKLVPMI